MITFIQWKQEQESLTRLREMVDRVCADITSGRILDEAELEQRVDAARAFCRALLPDKLDLFNMIYESRFRRLWADFGPRPGLFAPGCRRSPEPPP